MPIGWRSEGLWFALRENYITFPSVVLPNDTRSSSTTGGAKTGLQCNAAKNAYRDLPSLSTKTRSNVKHLVLAPKVYYIVLFTLLAPRFCKTAWPSLSQELERINFHQKSCCVATQLLQCYFQVTNNKLL